MLLDRLTSCPALPLLLPGALLHAQALPLIAYARQLLPKGAGDPGRRVQATVLTALGIYGIEKA